MRRPALEWRAAARADLFSIIDYIAADDVDAAQALKNDIAAKIAILPERPRLYKSGRLPGTREMPVRRRYIVVYTEDRDRVVILRILHTARLWP